MAAAFEPRVSDGFAGVVIAYFSVIGFLTSYLWTRILLTVEFNRAERAAQRSPEFFEGLSEAFLYQPPPGFQRAIEIGEQYLDDFGRGNWRVWRALSCGYAQRFDYLKNAPGSAASSVEQSKKDALEAIEEVLFLSPSERNGMQRTWDPALDTPQEDDLTSLLMTTISPSYSGQEPRGDSAAGDAYRSGGSIAITMLMCWPS